MYIACGYTDLRCGIDGLAAIVQQEFQLDPFTNTLFLFCGRRRGQKLDCSTISLAHGRVKPGASKGPTEPAEIRTGPSFCTNTSQDGEQSIQKNSRMDQGYLHTDGYTGYCSLPEEITVVGCWAHLRRKFDEAMKPLPKGKAKGSSAAQGLTYCDFLFKLEDSWTELTQEERYDRRLEQPKPVLDAMLAWTNTRTAAPKSAWEGRLLI